MPPSTPCLVPEQHNGRPPDKAQSWCSVRPGELVFGRVLTRDWVLVRSKSSVAVPAEPSTQSRPVVLYPSLSVQCILVLKDLFRLGEGDRAGEWEGGSIFYIIFYILISNLFYVIILHAVKYMNNTLCCKRNLHVEITNTLAHHHQWFNPSGLTLYLQSRECFQEVPKPRYPEGMEEHKGWWEMNRHHISWDWLAI